MKEIPSMWRTELWHPLSVHFPIGLLSLVGVLSVVYLGFRQKSWAPYFRFSLSLLLWVGLGLFWWAFYTGQLAYSIEVRKICDPTVLKDHLYWAYVAGYLFSGATVLDIAQRIWQKYIPHFVIYIMLLANLTGTAALGYAGHLGARVVYQQGAAVNQPSENCAEFE